MKVKELTERTGTYKPYEDPKAKGPEGEPLFVDPRGQVGYWKQQGRARNFIAYDPKAQVAATPDPYAIDYGAAATNMQGTPTTDPSSPEAQKSLNRILLGLLPGVGTALDIDDAITAAKKGDLGDAAAASVFAVLGLVPLAGAPTRAALKAAKDFIKLNPKFLQRAQGAKPTPARVEPALDPAPGTLPAARAQVDRAYPPTGGTAGRVETPPLGNTPATGANRLDPRVEPPMVKPEADPARIAALAGVTTAAGTAGKLAGKGDEVADIARLSGAADTATDAGRVVRAADEVPSAATAARSADNAVDTGRATRAADDVPTATVAKAADDVPAATTAARSTDDAADAAKATRASDDVPTAAAGGASAARVVSKGDEVADASRVTRASDDAADTAKAGKRADDVKDAAPVAAAGGRLASKADDVADAGKLTRAQRAAIAGAAAVGAGGAGYLASRPDAASSGSSAATGQAAKPADRPNLDTLSFGQAFAQARRLAAQQGSAGQGQFTWRGQKYQTNIAGEPYVPAGQQIKINEVDELTAIKKLLKQKWD